MGRERGSVFVNCPFDESYKPIFDAVAFGIIACSFRVRSALEITDSGELRLEKIYRLIGGATHSVHDISRVELDGDPGLPRFNMPIELGIALGHKRFSGTKRPPRLLIMDSERFRYQRFASDLAGLDIAEHGNTPAGAIARIRDFLACDVADLPTSDVIVAYYETFEHALPEIAKSRKQSLAKLGFADRLNLAEAFVESLTE